MSAPSLATVTPPLRYQIQADVARSQGSYWTQTGDTGVLLLQSGFTSLLSHFCSLFLASELARKEQLIGLQQRMKGAEAVRQVITLEPDPPERCQGNSHRGSSIAADYSRASTGHSSKFLMWSHFDWTVRL